MKRCQLLAQVESSTEMPLSREIWSQLDGLVADSAQLKTMQAAADRLQLCGPMADYSEHQKIGGLSYCDGLEATQREQQTHPGESLICRVAIQRMQPRFNINRSDHGSGFIFYAPQPETIRGYQVVEDEQSLASWLQALAESEVEHIWIHNPEADRLGQGLDLDLLERVRNRFQGTLWISGGVSKLTHMKNLQREGIADAVIIDLAMLQALGLDHVRAALRPHITLASDQSPPQSDEAMPLAVGAGIVG